VELDDGEERSRYVAPLPADSLAARVTRLRELGVTALICGGISRTLRQMIEAGGIRIYPWMAGPVEEVLKAFLSKQLSDPRWTMPGCGDRDRRRRPTPRKAAQGREES
jgi:predicted Fe-Mo cluster-binding NifX family protein